MTTEEFVRWFATINGVIAAIAVAGNFGRLVTGIGFVIFTLSSVAWILAGYFEDMSSLITQNIVLTVINLVGIYRYLIANGRPRGHRRFWIAAPSAHDDGLGSEAPPASSRLCEERSDAANQKCR